MLNACVVLKGLEGGGRFSDKLPHLFSGTSEKLSEERPSLSSPSGRLGPAPRPLTLAAVRDRCSRSVPALTNQRQTCPIATWSWQVDATASAEGQRRWQWHSGPWQPSQAISPHPQRSGSSGRRAARKPELRSPAGLLPRRTASMHGYLLFLLKSFTRDVSFLLMKTTIFKAFGCDPGV